MKTMIVYYSLEGNTEFTAQLLAKKTGADLLKLEPKKAFPNGKIMKYFWGGKSVVFNEKPPLSPYQFDESKYDAIIFGTPIWAGSFTPPLATFLQNHSLAGKKIGLFACHGGGGVDKCFRKFEAALPNSQIIARLGLVNPIETYEDPQNQQAIQNFCNSFVTGPD